MTNDQITLVQKSFESVVPISDQAADLFYDRLFTIAPDTKRMFPADMREQKKKLMQMLAVAVANLHKIGTIKTVVEQLGRRHVDYGVKPEHYATVGEALIWTLETGLGPTFTPEVKEAWLGAYTGLTRIMLDAGNQPVA